MDDVFIAAGRICAVAYPGVMQTTIRINPKYKLRCSVCEVTDRGSTTTEAFGQKVEGPSRLLAGNGTNGDHEMQA